MIPLVNSIYSAVSDAMAAGLLPAISASLAYISNKYCISNSLIGVIRRSIVERAAVISTLGTHGLIQPRQGRPWVLYRHYPRPTGRRVEPNIVRPVQFRRKISYLRSHG